MSTSSPSIHAEGIARQVSERSLRALDWLNFFLSDVRTGVGPFVAIYLAGEHWGVARIGIALTAAELAGVLTQAPGGALIDRLRSKRLVVGLAVLLLSASALLVSKITTMPVILACQAGLGITGSIFGPGVSAITLGLVGHACFGYRTGRNASFASAGNIFAAVSMGLLGYWYTPRSIFYLVALLAVPTIVFLLRIRPDEIDYDLARGGIAGQHSETGVLQLLRDRRLGIFALMTVLFHLANGAMLASAGEMMTKSGSNLAVLSMGALVTVPQLVMAVIGAPTGKIADLHGRKPILLFAFALLPLRALLFAIVRDSYWLIGLQTLDGFSAGIFMIVGVLMIADCTEGTGHFNLALGTMGAATGVGASLSTLAEGFVVQRFGYSIGFLCLALAAVLAWLVLAFWMPETRPYHLPNTTFKSS
jgi:MFS family permease